jgi:uncharacterized protein
VPPTIPRVDPKERAIRDLYDAPTQRDWNAVRARLAEQVGWHEPGGEDHSGDYKGRDDVVALLQKLVAVTDGTFQLEPRAFLNSTEHSAVLVRWWAERQGQRSEGNEIAVYRLSGGTITDVWFYVDGYEPGVFSQVFAFDEAVDGMTMD